MGEVWHKLQRGSDILQVGGGMTPAKRLRCHGIAGAGVPPQGERPTKQSAKEEVVVVEEEGEASPLRARHLPVRKTVQKRVMPYLPQAPAVKSTTGSNRAAAHVPLQSFVNFALCMARVIGNPHSP